MNFAMVTSWEKIEIRLNFWVEHPPLYVTFSVYRPSHYLSIAHHILRTVHYEIVTFDTHM